MNVEAMTLEELLDELPPQLQSEVKDFAEFLVTKHITAPKKSRRLRQDWANALEDDKDTYTSVELQHLAMKWSSETI